MSNRKKLEYSIVGILIVALAAAFLWFLTRPAAATAPEPYKVICHHNPAQDVTLSFQNVQSYTGHLGTPHSGSTYDTDGACPEVTPSVSPTASPTPTTKPCEWDCDEVTPTVTPEEHHAVPTDTPLEDRNQCTFHDCSTKPVVQNGKTLDLGPSVYK